MTHQLAVACRVLLRKSLQARHTRLLQASSELHGWRLSVTERPRDRRIDVCALHLICHDRLWR